MKKLLLTLFILGSLFRFSAQADEGMWIPMLIERLNHTDMQKLGLQLTAEEIYSVNNSSLKDAIVIFGRGCTGEIISGQGLLLTNHHCGYGSIQSVSSVENDYLKNGFWAKNHQEEIPIPGLTAQFLVRMEDVTSTVLDGIDASLGEKERGEKVGERMKEIVKSSTEGTHYNAILKEYYEGNEYYLLVYETFRDVRLAGTPPESIGKFGSDTDNWMWPRHTGDFSIFRVYAGADNKPAEYSTDNQPLKSRHFLPVSIDGVKKDDFAMILGNPGSTDRYLTSWGVEMAINETNPTRVKIRAEKLRIMDEGMEANEKVRLQYASKYAGVANYWKYFIGQTRGLKRLDVTEKKQQIEKDFTARIEADPNLMKKYGEALPLIKNAYQTLSSYNLSRWYMAEAIMQGSEILGLANRTHKLNELLSDKKSDQDAIQKEIDRLKKGADGAFKNYDKGIDQNLLARMLEMYYNDVPEAYQPALLRKMASKHKNDFASLAADVFGKSSFSSLEKVNALLANPKAKSIESDPAYQLIRAFSEINSKIQKSGESVNADMRRGNRLFVAGLREMQPQRTFYPNANFSLRLTYGTVQDYYPADAVHFDYVTTTKGILEKEDPSTWEFVVPEKLKNMIDKGDFGQYGNPDGTMTVNFLTNHDITGGNSGSPVIDGKGNLIGLAFDGNWEAMSGDIAFEPELQRTISVDIRYVLLIVDKFAGATNLINEMVMVKDGRKIMREHKSTEDSKTTR
ncbi:MAG: serine protease [Bacteroidetes bacterium HGW-Bacteroidetes-1]|jgi:hypothetical protein|nr:MAG: serine protease [Bacteroidetes bacterium HGW-Bacteroidetes-1]